MLAAMTIVREFPQPFVLNREVRFQQPVYQPISHSEIQQQRPIGASFHLDE